jgi:hypothetical protein
MTTDKTGQPIIWDRYKFKRLFALGRSAFRRKNWSRSSRA